VAIGKEGGQSKGKRDKSNGAEWTHLGVGQHLARRSRVCQASFAVQVVGEKGEEH